MHAMTSQGAVLISSVQAAVCLFGKPRTCSSGDTYIFYGNMPSLQLTSSSVPRIGIGAVYQVDSWLMQNQEPGVSAAVNRFQYSRGQQVVLSIGMGGVVVMMGGVGHRPILHTAWQTDCCDNRSLQSHMYQCAFIVGGGGWNSEGLMGRGQ